MIVGTHSNLGHDRYPRQDGYWFRRGVKVCFNHDPRRWLRGRVLRCDVEDPWRVVILLDDGRVVLSTECAYSALD